MIYSIWVVPPEPVYSQIKDCIIELAQRFDSPIFEPHMTLLGNIDKDISEIEEKVKDLASSIDKLELSLGSVSFSTTYFQSVFVRVNSTAKLMQLNIETKKLFGMENNVFMPHMSLLYGGHDMLTREKIAQCIKIESEKFLVNELFIASTGSGLKGWSNTVRITFD